MQQVALVLRKQRPRLVSRSSVGLGPPDGGGTGGGGGSQGGHLMAPMATSHPHLSRWRGRWQ